MLKMRKILSVALVVVMLLSTAVIGASALAEGKTFGLVLEADKTAAEIVPGATVTVTLKFEMADFDQLMSDSRICLLYDDTVYTPDLTTRTFVGDLAGYAKDTTKPTVNAAFATACMNNSTMSDAEKAKYNSGVMQQILASVGLGAASKTGFSVTEDADGISIPEMTLVFNVTGDEAAIAAGNIDIALCDSSVSAAQYIKKTDGSSTPKVISGTVDASKASIVANMPAAAASILQYSKAQIRFAGIGATSTSADYQGTFDVRTVAKISQADFLATFESEENAIEKISDFGFIYATTSNVAAFDLDTAKAVAEGGSADNYVKKSVNYMQHTGDGADYIFTCLISNIADADKTDGVSCLGYVCFDGTYYYFDAAATVSFNTLYTAYMPA